MRRSEPATSINRKFHRNSNYSGVLGNGLSLTRLARREGQIGVPDMLTAEAHFKPVIPWWLAIEEVGRSLRECYELPKELPPKLRRLVRKLVESLDAVEGNYLLRYSRMTRAEPRRAYSGDDDWLFPRISWQDDVDLLGGLVRR